MAHKSQNITSPPRKTGERSAFPNFLNAAGSSQQSPPQSTSPTVGSSTFSTFSDSGATNFPTPRAARTPARQTLAFSFSQESEPFSENEETLELQKDRLDDILCKHQPLNSLNDIKSFQRWDYSLPTLIHSDCNSRARSCLSHDLLLEAIKVHNHGMTYQILNKFGVFNEGSGEVALFGEPLVDLILNNESNNVVWTMQMIGGINKEAQFVEIAKNLVMEVELLLEKENKSLMTLELLRRKQQTQLDSDAVKVSRFNLSDLLVYRIRNTVTIHIPGRGQQVRPTTIRLVFAPCQSITHLLKAQFPHCNQVALHCGKIFISEAAQYCLQSVCIFADEKCFLQDRTDISIKLSENDSDFSQQDSYKLSPHISKRILLLKKYFDKGFDVVMPRLDLAQISRRNFNFNLMEVVDLPDLHIFINGIDEKMVFVQRIELCTQARELASSVENFIVEDEGGELVDLEMCASGDLSSVSIPTLTSINRHNIKCLLRNHHSNYIYVPQEGAPLAVVFDHVSGITSKMIDECYAMIKSKLRKNFLSPKLVFEYFCATPSFEILNELLIQPLKQMELECKYMPRLLHSEERNAAIDTFVDLEKQVLKDKLSRLRQMMASLSMNKVPFPSPPEQVSTPDQVLTALYGKFLYKKAEI